MSVRAIIDGQYPCLGSKPVRWEEREGVKPFETEIDLRPGDAESLLSGAMRPLQLELDNGRGSIRQINAVYATTMGVPENQHLRTVKLVDRRWFWGNTVVERHFNIPRVVGSKRQKAPDTEPELDPLDVKIAYWPGSLRNGETLWTARDILENILGQVRAVEGKHNGNIADWDIHADIGSRLDNLPIHDLTLSDAGDVALNRVLAYLPEAAIKIDTTGKIVIYSRATGAEWQMAQDAGAESVGGGHVEWISNARIRPKKIHVLFTREHELRFDFYEQASETFSTDERYMQNVMPIPDYTLTSYGIEYCQGTYLPFPSVLDAWGAPPGLTNLTGAAQWLKFIRRAMVPFFDIWSGALLHGLKDPDADWMARIGSIQDHYRRTFRISPRWMARIWQLKACKVATLDPTTGTRAPALAYADYARMPSQRAFWANGQGLSQVMNVKVSPTGPDVALSGNASPARVSIADHDQGIIHIDFVPDRYRVWEMTLPSMVEIDGSGTDANGRPTLPGPTGDINDTTRCIAFNAVGKTHKPPTLTGNHRVAVVLTAIPAGSNSSKAEQLHRETIEPSDVADLLPPALSSGIQQSSGPEMELRINPTIETARIPWVHARRQDIIRSFGINDSDAPLNIEDLISNRSADGDGGASLNAIAKAVAARTWAALTDRAMGSKTVRLNGQTQLVGSMESVAHEVAEMTGATQTIIKMADTLPKIDIFSLMPDSARRIVLRLAPSPGKQQP